MVQDTCMSMLQIPTLDKSIIDLDTMMCNSIIYDFGDAIRTSCNRTSENDSNINNVNFNFEFFKTFSKGYLKETKSFISKEELNLLSFSGILLALEQSIRFFTDYLNNDFCIRKLLNHYSHYR